MILLEQSIEWVGYAAAFFSTVAYCPQIYHLLRHRSAQDVSLSTCISVVMASFLWLIYGLYLWRWPLILCNGISLVFTSIMLGLKIRLDRL